MSLLDWEVVHVDNMPPNMEGGILYISLNHHLSAHLCPCGCKEEVYIAFKRGRKPLGKHEWDVEIKNLFDVSFSPSLKNRFKCQSHYKIKHSRTIWFKKREKRR